jgi:hypothetical protein
MPKAFMKGERFVSFDKKGKAQVSEEPTVFPDGITDEGLKDYDTKGLKLVSVYAIIDKPKPKWVKVK